MSRRLVRELTYRAPLADVAGMLADPAFREEVLERQQVLRGSATVEGGFVRIEQVRAAAGLPSFAQRLVGSEIVIVQEEEWSAPERADVTVTIPGKPGEITGTATLEEQDGTTVETVDLTISVRIPLVGGKVEGLVLDLLSRALDKEQATGTDWLAR